MAFPETLHIVMYDKVDQPVMAQNEEDLFCIPAGRTEEEAIETFTKLFGFQALPEVLYVAKVKTRDHTRFKEYFTLGAEGILIGSELLVLETLVQEENLLTEDQIREVKEYNKTSASIYMWPLAKMMDHREKTDKYRKAALPKLRANLDLPGQRIFVPFYSSQDNPVLMLAMKDENGESVGVGVTKVKLTLEQCRELEWHMNQEEPMVVMKKLPAVGLLDIQTQKIIDIEFPIEGGIEFQFEVNDFS